MTNTHEPELPLSQTYFHGYQGVRAIEILLYPHVLFSNIGTSFYNDDEPAGVWYDWDGHGHETRRNATVYVFDNPVY